MGTANNLGTIGQQTSHGYRILCGKTYRYNTVSGFVHVDEYVERCGTWAYMGWLVKAVSL